MRPARALLVAMVAVATLGRPAGGWEELDSRLVDRLEPAVAEHIRLAEGQLGSLLAQSAEGSSLGVGHARVARLYHAYGFFAEAEALYARAAELLPAEARWPYYLGRVRMALGRFDEAATAFAQASKLDPGLVEAKVATGRALLEGGEPASAFEMAAEVTQASPEDLAAWLLRAEAASALGEWEEARDSYARLLARQPEATRLYLPLAAAHRALGDRVTAGRMLRERGDGRLQIPDPLMSEIEQLATGSRILFNRGVAAFEQQDFDSAVDLFSQAVALDPANLQVRENLAVTLRYLGEMDRAEREYREILQLDPKRVASRYGLGVVLGRVGRETEAIEAYLQALEVDPEYREARFNLGNTQRRLGACREAIENFRLLLASDPADSRASAAQALCWVELGDDRLALHGIKTGLKADPASTLLAQLGARLMATSADAEVRDPEQALRLAEQLATLRRSRGHLETLAMALAAVGRYDAAVYVQSSTIESLANPEPGVLERMRSNLELYQEGLPASDAGWN